VNISAFDLNVLPIFEAVMQERNVSRAAARVGLSQPAVSNAIRRMREAIGDPLWIRHVTGDDAHAASRTVVRIGAGCARAHALRSFGERR